MRYGLHPPNNILWAPRPVACYALRMKFGKLVFIVLLRRSRLASTFGGGVSPKGLTEGVPHRN